MEGWRPRKGPYRGFTAHGPKCEFIPSFTAINVLERPLKTRITHICNSRNSILAYLQNYFGAFLQFLVCPLFCLLYALLCPFLHGSCDIVIALLRPQFCHLRNKGKRRAMTIWHEPCKNGRRRAKKEGKISQLQNYLKKESKLSEIWKWTKISEKLNFHFRSKSSYWLELMS